jgi:hypothetical protein
LNQAERDLIHSQRTVAKWLIKGTNHKDLLNKETAATVPTEWIYDYISDCVGEPHPRCAPQQLDGTVTEVPNVFHYELFQDCNELSQQLDE